MADDLTPSGVLRGLLVLALMWWAWVGHAWLGNLVRPDEGVGRAAMFVLALSIPEAFGDFEGGLNGPVVVAIAYFAVRVLHQVIFWVAGGDDPGLRRQLIRFIPSWLIASALPLVASQLDGAAQTAAWATNGQPHPTPGHTEGASAPRS